MKFNKEIIKKAHEMTKEIKKEYLDVDYKTQFGLCLSFLLSEKKGGINKTRGLKGTEKQVKWAEDIIKEVISINDYLLENVNDLEEEKRINKAKKIYTTSKEYLENISEATVFIENFKEILKVKKVFESETFETKFNIFKNGIKNLGLKAYSRLGAAIKTKIAQEEGLD